MRENFFTVPNQHVFADGVSAAFLSLVIYDHYILALTVLLLAGFRRLDGLLARKLNQKTALGAYLTDCGQDAALIFIPRTLVKGKILWWLTILVLTRD